jgi:PAS domain S-box-containing protein
MSANPTAEQEPLESVCADEQQAEATLRKQGELLCVTPASIGDAVLSTDAEGRVTFLNPTRTTLGSTEDVTESKQAARALEASEIRYRRLFETARDAILILDGRTGKIIDSNPFLRDLLGYSHDELQGKELWEIGLFRDIEASRAAFRQLQERVHPLRGSTARDQGRPAGLCGVRQQRVPGGGPSGYPVQHPRH